MDRAPGVGFSRLGHVEHSAQGGGTGPVDVLAFRSHPRCGVVGETLRFSGADTSRAGDATAFDPLERATVAMGSGGGRGEDGGGSGASGAARRTPPTPRLSTFLRTFGTTLAARAGVDVDAEYVSRRAILDARLSTAAPLPPPSPPPPPAREAPPPPRSRDPCAAPASRPTATRATRSRPSSRRSSASPAETPFSPTSSPTPPSPPSTPSPTSASPPPPRTRCDRGGCLRRDPDLVRRGEAESREWTRKKKKALAAAVGPIADQHFPAFERAAHALAAMREERDVRERANQNADEFGADWDFVPPGTGAFTTPSGTGAFTTTAASGTPRAGSTLAASMRAGLAASGRRGSSSTPARTGGGVRGRRLPSGRRRRRRGFRRSRGERPRRNSWRG